MISSVVMSPSTPYMPRKDPISRLELDAFPVLPSFDVQARLTKGQDTPIHVL